MSAEEGKRLPFNALMVKAMHDRDRLEAAERAPVDKAAGAAGAVAARGMGGAEDGGMLPGVEKGVGSGRGAGAGGGAMVVLETPAARKCIKNDPAIGVNYMPDNVYGGGADALAPSDRETVRRAAHYSRFAAASYGVVADHLRAIVAKEADLPPADLFMNRFEKKPNCCGGGAGGGGEGDKRAGCCRRKQRPEHQYV